MVSKIVGEYQLKKIEELLRKEANMNIPGYISPVIRVDERKYNNENFDDIYDPDWDKINIIDEFKLETTAEVEPINNK